MWKNRFVLKDGLSKDETLLEIAKHLQMQFILEENLILYDDTLRPLPGKATIFFIDELAKYGVIEFVKPWGMHSRDKSTYFCELRLTEKLDEFCRNGKSNPCVDSKAKLILSHTSTGKLLINDIFLIHKTDVGSINDRILRFLIKNPNRVFERADLEKKGILNTKKKEDKDFHIVLSDIGIKEDFKKVFFGKCVTKHSICLTNPVNQEDFDRAGIEYIDLRKFVKKKNQKDKEVDQNEISLDSHN